MGNKVNKSKVRRGWQKKNAKCLNEELKVNVPVVDTSLQNKESSDRPMKGPVPIIPEQNSCLPMEVEKDNELSYSHKENNAMKLPFAEKQELQKLSAIRIARTQNDPNLSTHHSSADSDEEEGCYVINPEEKVEEVRISGNIVVDFIYLFEQLQEISHHNSPFGCILNHLELIGEKRKGFKSKLKFICKMCRVKLSLKNCKESTDKKELDLDENVISGFMSIGAGYAGLEQVSASLEIPSMSDHLYAKCHARVCDLWEMAKEKCMEEAAKEEYDLAVRDGNVNADGVPMITVVKAILSTDESEANIAIPEAKRKK